MTQTLNADLVILALNHGVLDDGLDSIIRAANTRRQYLAASKAITLKPGDQFYLVNIKPKYLSGCRVEYRERDGDWLVCRMMEHASDRFSHGSIIRLRNSHVGTVVPQ